MSTPPCAALRFLVESNESTLPISPTMLAKRNGWQVHTYSDYFRATGKTAAEVVAIYGSDGFTNIVSERFVIFLNPSNHPARRRWTLAHEMGHIVLRHLTDSAFGHCQQAGSLDLLDREADAFAASLLCPEVIVHFCGVRCAHELQTLTALSMRAAEVRWAALCSRRVKNDFLQLSEERSVFMLFRHSITDYLTHISNSGQQYEITLPTLAHTPSVAVPRPRAECR